MQQKPGRTMARPARAKARPLILALLLGLALPGAGHAFGFGHARLLSASGQPLRVEVPITQLTADEQGALQVSLAPADAWSQAGLVPPVALDSLQVQLVDGAVSGTRVARVLSSQPFDGAVADVLIDVRTASGQQRHQVSLLSQPRPPQVLAASTPSTGGGPGTQPVAAGLSTDAITIRRGDTLFAIARRHAVPGVSLYQLMIALYQANPQAFIDGNLNLIKAGATLRVPDAAALTAISDSEARRLFAQHARAFAGGRQRVAASAAPAPADAVPADRGQVSASQGGDAPAAAAPRDQLKLSGAASGGGATADAQAAVQKDMQESQSRVSTLEDNVRQLSAALQAQGASAGGAPSVPGAVAGAASAAMQGSEPGASGAAQAANAQAQPAAAASAGGSAQGGDPAQGGGAGVPAASSGSTVAGASGGNASQGANAVPAAQSGGAAGAASGTQSAAAGASGAASAAASVATPSSASTQSGTGAAQPSAGWFSGNVLGVVVGLLALLVLVVAWLLRRANVKSDEPENGGRVTGTMIQHKLDVIDLDLQRPASDVPDDRR